MPKLFIVDIFANGGPIMLAIVACSVFALAVVIERIRFYNRHRNNSVKFIKAVKSALISGAYCEAMRICREEASPLANVIAAGIDRLDLKKEDLLDVMRQEALVQLKKYDRHIGKLATIASITPLLGLTGTVTGMISAFTAITAGGMGDAAVLAGGISEALYTTAAGLFVGIPSLVAHNWCESKSREFAEQIEIYSLELANLTSNMEINIEKAAA